MCFKKKVIRQTISVTHWFQNTAGCWLCSLRLWDKYCLFNWNPWNVPGYSQLSVGHCSGGRCNSNNLIQQNLSSSAGYLGRANPDIYQAVKKLFPHKNRVYPTPLEWRSPGRVKCGENKSIKDVQKLQSKAFRVTNRSELNCLHRTIHVLILIFIHFTWHTAALLLPIQQHWESKDRSDFPVVFPHS